MARLTESTEVWAMLDKAAAGVSANSGSLRAIVLKELKARAERKKSISLNGLFDEYLQKLQRNHRSEHYTKAFKWYFREFLEEKVSDLKASDIAYAFEELPGGQFNANLRLIRAVFNYGAKIGYLKSNPALNLEFVYRPKVEVKPLPNAIVRAMLNDAATNPERTELLPYLSVGSFLGCREAELFKILWSDVFLAESRVFSPALSRTPRPPHRVGGGVAPAVLPHHRTYGPVSRRLVIVMVFRQKLERLPRWR